MKKLLLLACLLWSAALPAEAAKPAPVSPLEPLTSLVGGFWVTDDLPGPAGAAPGRIELRFAWSENHQAIRFDSAFVQGDQRRPYTSGLYGWDGAKKKLVIFYMDSSGSLTAGTITPGGNVLVNELTVTDPAGKVQPVRVRLIRIGADVFDNEIFVQKDGAMTHFLTVRYQRK